MIVHSITIALISIPSMLKNETNNKTSKKCSIGNITDAGKRSWLRRIILKSFRAALCAFVALNLSFPHSPSLRLANETPTFNQGTSKQVQLSVWNQATTTCPKTKHSDSIIYIPSVLTSTLRQTLISNIGIVFNNAYPDILTNCSVTSQVKIVRSCPYWELQAIAEDGTPKEIGGDEFYVTYTDDFVNDTDKPSAVAHVTDQQDGTYRLEFVSSPLNHRHHRLK